MYRSSDGITYTTWQKDAEDIDTMDIDGRVVYMVENAGRWSATWTDGPAKVYLNAGDETGSDTLTHTIATVTAKK